MRETLGAWPAEPATLACALTAGRGAEALSAVLDVVDGKRGHPWVAELRTLLPPVAAQRRARTCYADLLACPQRGARALALSQGLAELGLHLAALDVLALGYSDADPFAAYYRAQWALEAGEYELAVAAADVAIQAMMKRAVPVRRFVQACLHARAPQSLLRYRPREIVRAQRLRQPLVWRWEALHRAGRHAQARQMARLCHRLFPERVSVRVMAGNHALDRGEPEVARRSFAEALALAPMDVGALAGMAIVNETQKDWATALSFRQQVVQVSAAWQQPDPASLHRVVRLGAALGRLNHWREAGKFFRDSVRRGAYRQLPQERAVLLKVFSGPLYSPGMIMWMLAEGEGEPPPSSRGALHMAVPEALRRAVDSALTDGATLAQWSGMDQAACPVRAAGLLAWELGDPEQAYRHFDEADGNEPEMAINYWLWRSAVESAAPDQAGVAHFCLELARVTCQEPVDEEAMLYAQLALAQLTAESVQASALCGAGAALWALVERVVAANRSANDALTVLASAPLGLLRGTSPAWQTAVGPLRAAVALRETLRAAGYPERDLSLLCASVHLSLT